MPAAGEKIRVGRLPGQWIAGTEETADSSNFTTTETVVMIVNAPLVSGRTYRLRLDAGFQSSVAADRLRIRIREDNATGTVRNEGQHIVTTTATTTPYRMVMEALYTAASTATKTFVVTGERLAGSGNCRLEASSTYPSFLDVYHRG